MKYFVLAVEYFLMWFTCLISFIVSLFDFFWRLLKLYGLDMEKEKKKNAKSALSESKAVIQLQ